MDIIKLMEDADPLIAAPELNERFQGKVQNIFVVLAQSIDQIPQGTQQNVKLIS